jgi:endonuclease/exonuclease/phosphatase (EEP) superfamily protein YafD
VIRTPKSTLLSWIEIAGSDAPLLLVNLHAINFRLAAALDAQLQSLDAVIEAHVGPLVVAGDFNTWSRRRRVVVEEFVARHALMSAFPGITEVTRFDQVYLRGLVVRDAAVLKSRSSDHDALRIELALPPQ